MFEIQAKALADAIGNGSAEVKELIRGQLISAYNRGQEDKMQELRAALGAASDEV